MDGIQIVGVRRLSVKTTAKWRALVPEWAMPLKLERAAKVDGMAFGWYMKSLPARARRRALQMP